MIYEDNFFCSEKVVRLKRSMIFQQLLSCTTEGTNGKKGRNFFGIKIKNFNSLIRGKICDIFTFTGTGNIAYAGR